MDRNSKVYLFGPITGVPGYKKKFKNAQRELWDQGIAWIINPVEIISHYPMGMTYEQIMSQCYSMMSLCDTVVLLPGWRKSEGCKKELRYAEAHGMRIEEVKV